MQTILVVDDESESLRLLCDILSTEGYQVRLADTSELALAFVEAELPDLILVDVHLPGIDGFEFCRRLKRLNRAAAVPVIFVSASSDVNTTVRGLAMGAVDYLLKPFRREELLARVRTHLELGRLRGQLETEVELRTTELRAAVEQLNQEIVERSQAESALRESEQRFRIMADTAPVSIWISGPDKLCTFFNQSWLEFTGRTIEQELGEGWADGVHQDDLDRCLGMYRAQFDLRRPFKMEYRLRRNDGEYRWMVDQGVPRIAPGGKFLGYIGSCIDITDIRRAQEEAVAKARVESLRVLAGGMAHDFTNLMSTILATAEIAEIGMAGGSSPEIEIIKAVAEQAVGVARELMIYAGQDKGRLEPLDLSQLVEEMMEILKASVPKTCVLKADLQKNLPAIWGNATHMRQVLMNLIINAAEAIGDSEGIVQIRTSMLPAGNEPRGISGTKYVSLEVTDTGMGMTESQESRIFDPFFTTKEKGHGLGLAVVHGIVHSHGGCIDVASEPGRGTTFDIHFPCAEIHGGGTAARNGSVSAP